MSFFRMYDRVSWTSGASGTQTVKHGKIVAVLGPNEVPKILNPATGAFLAIHVGGGTEQRKYSVGPFVNRIGRGHEPKARDHVSYVVLVEEPAGRRGTLYWPKVENLKADPVGAHVNA